jgi:hypothetical protein
VKGKKKNEEDFSNIEKMTEEKKMAKGNRLEVKRRKKKQTLMVVYYLFL